MTREPTPASELDPETAFRLLSADRRRAVVTAICEAQRPVSTESLTRLLAAREERVPPGRVSFETRRAIRRDLEQTHLPRLDSHDVVARRDGDRYAADRNLHGLLALADAADRHLGRAVATN